MNKKNFDYNCINNQIDSFIESNNSFLNKTEVAKQPKSIRFKLMLMAAPVVALAGYVLSII
ncbi:hypothetical protein BRE01_62490 [Brevibacillus reuszeri]|uniref:Uncharacterized protein n=1 Tax=Brevibacillus reuszeri TaxID=54915 RepID=A0A0K9YW33_9BACL|nr:hypothetical protein [Brevibacillus reuszeri]KNB72939.1 hypothetical protein ADS79_14030 [Brevibacillus reuszeri]GED72547.1 hypothetical protein BRE01_62490 [Brevibacillus reuszeri]